MKSRFGSRFCHDDDAAGYDQEVRNESHPIRKGYASALAWLGSEVPPRSRVLDLGTGTGNTILALHDSCAVTAVDISPQMLQIAAQKTAGRDVRFVLSDMLQFFDRSPESFDVIVSGYAVHHLTDSEKETLFDLFEHTLRRPGRAVIVDLMYKNKLERASLMNRYAHSHPGVARDIGEEFFWNLEKTCAALEGRGFSVSTRKFSDLSWGLVAAW